MTNSIAIAIIAVCAAINIGIILKIAFFDYKKNKDRLLLYMLGLCVSLLGWQVMSIIYYLVSDPEAIKIANELKLPFVAFTSFFIMILVIRFYRLESYLNRSTIILMLIIPCFTLIYSIFAVDTQIIREVFDVVQIDPVHIVYAKAGPWFWVHTASCYIFIMGSLILSLYCHNKLPRVYRIPSLILIIGLFSVIIMNVLVILGIGYESIDSSLIGGSIATIAVYFAVIKNKGVDFITSIRNEIYDYLDEGIMVLNDERYIVYVNRSARKMGVKVGLVDINTYSFYDDLFEATVGYATRIEAAPADEDGLDMTFIRKKEELIFNLSEKPIKDNKGMPIGTLVKIEDVTENRAIINKLENIGGIDALTGFANRRSIEKFMNNLNTNEKMPVAVISGDINGLKNVNDNLGHKQGDVLIRLVAEIMADVCPPRGRVSRVGGDEFLIVIPNCDEFETKSVIRNMEQMMDSNDSYSFKPSVSFGYELKLDAERTFDDVITVADRKMYAAKSSRSRGYRRDEMEFKCNNNRIYLTDDEDNMIAEVTFPNVKEGIVNINHTYVDDILRGKGMAADLMDACYDEIKRQDKKAVVSCPYAVKWFEEHPEKKDIVKE